MDADVLLFFDKQRAALPMYEAFEQALFERLPDTRMKVQKTQISFYNKHQFCCVSFLRVRKKKSCQIRISSSPLAWSTRCSRRVSLPLPSLIQIAGRIMWCSLLRLKWTTNSCAGLRKQRRFLL